MIPPKDETDRTGPLASPLVVLAAWWMLGVSLGHTSVSVKLWLTTALGLILTMGIMALRRKPIAVRSWAWLSAAAVAAAWTSVWQTHLPADDVAHLIGTEPQLAQVTGVVESTPYFRSPQRGEFGQFSYQQPATVFIVQVQSLLVDDTWRSANGRLLARIGQADHHLRSGDRVFLTGWLGPINGRSNPGESDYRGYLADRGIHGRISLPRKENCRILERDAHGRLQTWRDQISQAASSSLRLGMTYEPESFAFLDIILLGRRSNDLALLDDQFRRVGLAHLLAISGAHLAILLGLVWLVTRCVVMHPPRVALVVLVVLGLYLLAVPMRTPIVRAAVMAALVCVGYALDRPIRGLDLICLAAIVVLIWRPGDLLAPGFQLSFGVVTGLLVYAKPVSQWLWPDHWLMTNDSHAPWIAVAQWVTNYLAVSVVAFLIALPLVAYHFQLVSPLAVAISLVALPIVTVLLAIGYVKIVAGLLLPSVGVSLAPVLQWCAGLTTDLVEQVSAWRFSSIQLSGQPSVAWTLAALAVMVALLHGWFARRRLALASAAGLCLIGLLDARPLVKAMAFAGLTDHQPAIILNMFSVGDGSCYLVRLKGDQNAVSPMAQPQDDSAPNAVRKCHTLMFDCGSQAYMNVGSKTIVPTLAYLNVDWIDTLIISHADLDHFNGSLAVIDDVGVGRIMISVHMLALARQQPESAAGFFVHALEQRHVPYHAVSKGWRQTLGGAQLEILWPPADLVPPTVNDTSLVLLIQTADRRVMLNGDIQQQSISQLLDNGEDLRADVCDLPHHGSYVPASPRWLQAVRPTLVLQSSGPARLRHDRWKRLLDGSPTKRLVSAQVGMVQLTIERDGAMSWTRFKDP